MEAQNPAFELTRLNVDDDKLVWMIHQGLLKRVGMKDEAMVSIINNYVNILNLVLLLDQDQAFAKIARKPTINWWCSFF